MSKIPKFSFKTLAEDALRLEINTIIKPEMSGCKMPASRREALWSLATKYHKKLEELDCRGEKRWQSAGIMSFLEFYDCAAAEAWQIKEQLKSAPVAQQATLKYHLLILYRIQRQSEQIVSMFGQLAQAEGETLNVRELRQKIHNINTEKHKSLADDAFIEWYDAENKHWNNDVSRAEMGLLPDLKLDVAQVTLLRKAWEIGTEEILLQSVIQIDGDVTTRISERFANNQNPFILEMHNDAINTSVTFWRNIVKTIGEMASSLAKGTRDLLR